MCSVGHEQHGCSTSVPVSAEMGDHLRAVKPSQNALQPPTTVNSAWPSIGG